VELLPAGEAPPPRLPEPARFHAAGRAIPRIVLAGHEAATPDKVAFALDAACGRLHCIAGAFESFAAPAGAT